MPAYTWTGLGPSVHGSSAFGRQGNLGYFARTNAALLDIFNYVTRTWEQVATVGPTPGATEWSWGGPGVLLGNLWLASPTSLWAFNIENKTWTQVAAPPVPMFGWCVHNNEIWTAARTGDRLYRYNPVTNSWSAPIMTTRPGNVHAGSEYTRWWMASYKQFIYFHGAGTRFEGSYTRNKYNTVSGEWTALPNMGSDYKSLASPLSAGGFHWICGGTSGAGYGINVFECFDPKTDTLVPADSNGPPTFSASGALTEHNGLIYLFGVQAFDNSAQNYVYEPGVTMAPDTSEFTGEDGASIYPAPEPIPHRFTERDFPELNTAAARKVAKMLNDNFEAAERQLLALDPDRPLDADPYR